jgi:hypothetical protein
VGLFTIHFELGDKTLETLTRIASTSVFRFELGPETRGGFHAADLVATTDTAETRKPALQAGF